MKTKWKPWHEVVTLRDELKTGELSMAMFAADLDEVILRKGRRPIYEDPSQFFSLTYPTYNLRLLARDVVRRLAGKTDKAVRQLNLTYGGGKTHTLIALYHLSNEPVSLPKLPAVEEFRTAIDLEDGLPRARVAAISFDKLDLERGIETAAPDGTLRRLFHPWSVLAWQLGGEKGLALLSGGKGDKERETAPAENVMAEILALPEKEGRSCLILLDEILMYARQRVVSGEGWLAKLQAFFQALTQAAVKTDRCAVVASLLASEISVMDETGRKIANSLKDIFSRQQEEPVEPVQKDDVAEVLRRRFFTPDSIQGKDALRPHAIAAFKGLLAHDEATKKAGAQAEKRFVDSYPFHPDLNDVFYSKWVHLDQFQRTRGVLRIYAMALRDAAKWDPCPVVGPNAFLSATGETGLSDAMRELVLIADAQSTEGQRIAWSGILDQELRFAKDIQRDLTGLQFREMEQGVLSVFFHSQPTGENQRANARDLKLLLAPTSPDRIELEKGLIRWAQESYWLDDRYTATDGSSLPEVWRVGNRPNLTQIHREKKRQIEGDPGLIDVRLDAAIRSVKKLTDAAHGSGIRVHQLPEKPSDVEDDGKFHFAVMGPEAASDSGKPSPLARRFLDETTSAAKPRVYRNAVVLAVPSKDGIDVVRSRVADLLAWEQVAAEIEAQHKQGSVDAQRLQRLTVEVEKAKKLVPDAIRQAWCMVVTVSQADDVHAFKVGISDDPLFTVIKNDSRSRIQETKVTAAALLPGGPYDLWKKGETVRRVKDLAGAFAQLPHLPKMLNIAAIQETLVDGCAAGDFVLRVVRPDRTVRSWWRQRPDEEAIKDPDIEVVLTTGAELAEISPAMLRAGGLPGLWEGRDSLTPADIKGYFAGGHVVQIDRGGFQEPQRVPKATIQVVEAAIGMAVAAGELWLVSGPTSLFREEIPPGVLSDGATLLPPPPPVVPAELLDANIPAAWQHGEANGAGILAQISAMRGMPIPWRLISDAVEAALRARILELASEPATWPCLAGSAAHARFRATGLVGKSGGDGGMGGGLREKGMSYQAELKPEEIQDLADEISKLLGLQTTHGLRIRFLMTVAAEKLDGSDMPEEAKSALREALAKVSEAFN